MKHILVIGATGGIGRGTLEVLSQNGYCPIAADISVPDDFSYPAYPVDVSDPNSVDQLFSSLESDEILLSGIVNLAGITRDKTLLKMDDSLWEQVIQVNLTGSFNVIKRGALHMKEHGGSMVFVGSTAALNGNFGQVNYAASKAGIQGLVRSSARELARYGIRVNCIVPGFIDTEMTRKIPETRIEELLKRIPLARAGTPTEVGNLIEFLISDKSSYITGSSILIDGGLRM
ncbi:MAG: SDR family oxidoreductase [Gammaproteobacteria bacterium]|nr:MAG: SDR family oxidoreductase [Gammaproteobacteria bacterium]